MKTKAWWLPEPTRNSFRFKFIKFSLILVYKRSTDLKMLLMKHPRFSKRISKYFYTFKYFFSKKSSNRAFGTNSLLWPPIYQNKSAITSKWFNSLDTNSSRREENNIIYFHCQKSVKCVEWVTTIDQCQENDHEMWSFKRQSRQRGSILFLLFYKVPEKTGKNNFDHDRTWTCNPQIRSLMPYPFGHMTLTWFFF